MYTNPFRTSLVFSRRRRRPVSGAERGYIMEWVRGVGPGLVRIEGSRRLPVTPPISRKKGIFDQVTGTSLANVQSEIGYVRVRLKL